MASRLSPLIAVVGPTASGKSALALRLARERDGEVVSCDSLQVYRGLEIGSAKVSRTERETVPHHLLDVLAPDESFSAAEYAARARAALDGIRARGRLAIVAGGTGLYLRALLLGLFSGPGRDQGLRARLEAMADRFGDVRLHRVLVRVDAVAAGRIAPGDRRRIVRALEVYRATGRPISVQQEEGSEPLCGFDVLLLGLRPQRARLRVAVEARTREMLGTGLVAEVRGLLSAGFSPRLSPLQAIGYRQALAVIAGEMTTEEAERSIVTETMRLAKRQMTWLRHQQPGIDWYETVEEAHDAAIAWLDARDRCVAGERP